MGENLLEGIVIGHVKLEISLVFEIFKEILELGFTEFFIHR